MTRYERRRRAARRRRIRRAAFFGVVVFTALICAGLGRAARADESAINAPEIREKRAGYIVGAGYGPPEISKPCELSATNMAETASEPDRPYTEEDVIALAKMAYGEALITGSDTEMSASMWCACNRLDSGSRFYEGCESVFDIVTQDCQFYGYDESNPIDEHLVWLARDVLDRWVAEKNGAVDVGRTLPQGYCFFLGDGWHNHFTTEHGGGIEYDWSLTSPYES